MDKNRRKTSFMDFWTKEYPQEKYLMLLLAFILIIFACVLGMGRLTLESINWFGKYTDNVFTYGFAGLGIIAIIVSFWEQIVVAIKEMKKVTWPTQHTMFGLSIRVFSFIAILALFFLAVDSVVAPILPWLKSLVE